MSPTWRPGDGPDPDWWRWGLRRAVAWIIWWSFLWTAAMVLTR